MRPSAAIGCSQSSSSGSPAHGRGHFAQQAIDLDHGGGQRLGRSAEHGTDGPDGTAVGFSARCFEALIGVECGLNIGQGTGCPVP